MEQPQTFLKSQPCCLEKGSEKMCLPSGIADRGTDQVVKLFDVIGCQVSQIGILAMVPDLFHRIKVRRIARQPFNMNGLGVRFYISPQCFCPVDTPSIHDKYYPAMNIPGEGAQENNHILSTDVFSLNAPVKSNPASIRSESNGTDDRESVMTAPLAEYRCLSSGRPRPPHHWLEHESTLIQKYDASPFLFSVFLYPAIFLYANSGFPSHSFPWPASAAFDSSNRKLGGSSRRGPDDTLHQNDSQLPWLSVAVSKVDLHTHEPEALQEVIPEVPLSVLGTNGKAGPGEVSPSTLVFLLSLSPPSSVLQKMAMIPLAGLPLECLSLSPTGLLLAVFELPVLLHFPLASCIILYYCSISNARLSKTACA